MMRFPLMVMTAAAAVAAAVAAGGAANAAASVEVKDAVARVTVIPENRSDIKVEIVQANPQLPLKVRTMGDRTIIDGDLDRKIRSCHGSGETSVVTVRGLGDVSWREMPQVVIRTPRDTNIDTGGAIWGTVGRTASLKLGNAGCGDWIVANVDGAMQISQAGSGDTRAGSAAQAKIRVAGSGDTSLVDVRGPLEVDIAGSGDVHVGSVNGTLGVHTAGSGDVKVAGGHATMMTAVVLGSGNVVFNGSADSLKARIAGSGDVHARDVKGQIEKTMLGSGRVSTGN